MLGVPVCQYQEVLPRPALVCQVTGSLCAMLSHLMGRASPRAEAGVVFNATDFYMVHYTCKALFCVT